MQFCSQQGLDIDLDDDFIPDDGAVVRQFAIPAHLEVMPVDARFTDEADARNRPGVAGVGPIRRAPFALVVHRQNHGPADASDSQVARHFEIARADALAAGALERDGRMLLHIQEVAALEMGVALWLAGPELFRLDGRLDGQLGGHVRVECQPAVHVFEVAAHPANHHVPGETPPPYGQARKPSGP